jgi:hypothetical protein
LLRIGVHEEGKERPNVPAAIFVVITSTNDRILLDINTIPEAAKIKKVHALMQLHGPKCKSKETIKNYLNKLKSMKKQLREFAADAIKAIMVDEAKN